MSTDIGRAAARGASVTLSAQAVKFVLQAVSLVVLARLLTPADFGLVAMATAVIGIAEILRDFGLSSAAIQAKTLSDAERSNLFWTNTAIGFVCGAVIAAGAPLIAGLYGDPSVQGIVWALAWLLVISGMNTQFWAELSRSLRFRSLAVTDITAQASGVAAAITVAVAGGGYWAIVVQQIVVVCVTFAGNALQSGWWPSWFRRGVDLRPFLRYGGGLLGMQSLGYVTNNVDSVAIGSAWGAEQLGFYSRAYQLLIVPLNQVSTALVKVVLPVLSRVQDDQARLVHFLHRAQLVCLYLFGVGFAVAAGLSQPLVELAFGPDWAPVAPVFAVLAVGGIFRGYAQLAYWLVLARGLTGVQLRLYLMIRPLMIACLLLGLPWGALGVAVGHSVAFGIEWLVSAWWIGRRSGIAMRPFVVPALVSLVWVALPAAVVAWGVGQWLTRPVWGVLVGGALALLVAGLMLLIWPRGRTHLGQARSMVHNLRRRRA